MKVRKLPIIVDAEPMSLPFEVETLEGTMRGKPGDWLITGIEGEQYPCASHIFQKTFTNAADYFPTNEEYQTAIYELTKVYKALAKGTPTEDILKALGSYLRYAGVQGIKWTDDKQ